MDCEVAVVGGGIGGLTIAALLAKRGMRVCLLERQPIVGGCAANFEKFGYTFEQGDGLYTGWERDNIHHQILSELSIEGPEVRPLDPSYVVRLPDRTEISFTADNDQFNDQLARTFPECAHKAISFFNELSLIARTWQEGDFNLNQASRDPKSIAVGAGNEWSAKLRDLSADTTAPYLKDASSRFKRFIDAQLQNFAQGDSEEISYLYAALILTAARGGMFAIRGGAATLAQRLAESIKASGGVVRVDTPVLRLSFDTSGKPAGVDLLSGETVRASKAIISNLTVWDTYGKLVGLSRSPPEVRKELKETRGWGAYLLYLALEEDVAKTLPAAHLLSIDKWERDNESDQVEQLMFAAAPEWDPRAPDGKRAVTVHTFTDVDSWFTFHRDETEIEESDQSALESVWNRLHGAMPELGDGVEVIETATPQTFYDLTRRKLGMVGGLPVTPERFWPINSPYQTSFPNLYIISDTRLPGGVAGVTRGAQTLANFLTQ
jgi:C-3',4' desaturase CrtD